MSKQLTGVVVSAKMQKTALVQVGRTYRHRLYQKVIRRHKNYKVHYDGQVINVGDKVVIKEVRPLSKDKNFLLVKKID